MRSGQVDTGSWSFEEFVALTLDGDDPWISLGFVREDEGDDNN